MSTVPMKQPDDMLTYWDDIRGACKTFWNSHGCHRPTGHEGGHWCDCCLCVDHPDPDSGCVAGPPYYGPDTKFY